MKIGWNCQRTTRPQNGDESSGDIDEGQTIHKKDVREVPDHPAARSRLGYLPQPPTQAEAGLR